MLAGGALVLLGGGWMISAVCQPFGEYCSAADNADQAAYDIKGGPCRVEPDVKRAGNKQYAANDVRVGQAFI